MESMIQGSTPLAWGAVLAPRVATAAPGLLLAMQVAHGVDVQNFSLPVALLRNARRARLLLAPEVWPSLARNVAFAQHVAGAGGRDPMFFLSHRDYLARGLTTAQRLRAASVHYRHEVEAMTPAYLRAVYRDGGLRLWQRAVAGVTYDITLTPGNDVAHEGGLSLVFRVDGGRVFVLSFSLVPADVPGLCVDALAPDTLHMVTRKQSTRDRSYQAAFNKAFNRSTPAHLCFGAMQGVAAAFGRRHLAGVTATAQASADCGRPEVFERSYDDFWRSMGGEKVSPRAFLIEVPARLPPLEGMDPAHRRRARARRRHAAAIADEVCEVIKALRRVPASV